MLRHDWLYKMRRNGNLTQDTQDHGLQGTVHRTEQTHGTVSTDTRHADGLKLLLLQT